MAAVVKPQEVGSGNLLGARMSAPVEASDDYIHNAGQLQSPPASVSPHDDSPVPLYWLAVEGVTSIRLFGKECGVLPGNQGDKQSGCVGMPEPRVVGSAAQPHQHPSL